MAVDNLGRCKKTDVAIEGKFGKPNYAESFTKGGLLYTPLIGNSKIFRVDQCKMRKYGSSN